MTEETASPVSSAISVMLLGSIGFQMVLFYLVNTPDTDIRLYSWQVISQTVSIFCAVLLFQAINGIVEEYVIGGGSEAWEVSVDMMQLLAWLTLLQVVLAVTSGAVNELSQSWSRSHRQRSMRTVELHVKSWSVLFSHVAGFASINAWGSIQQHLLRLGPLTALGVVPVGACGLLLMYFCYDSVRHRISMADDGKVDEWEEKWDEETEEAEDDVAGISLSFLTVQAVRFAIGGALPDQEGLEDAEAGASHGLRQVSALVASGAAFGLLGLLIIRADRLACASSERVLRIIKILNFYLTVVTAWCLFYGVKWALSAARFTDEGALLAVVIALALSAMAFVVIFMLDFIADTMGGSGREEEELVQAAIDKMIQGLGILIGFSWEQAFDTAVATASVALEGVCPKTVSKLVMSCLLVAVVFPAWKWYILPNEQELLAALTTEEGERKYRLKEMADQHYTLFLSEGADDGDLDKAHLRMKQYRRETYGNTAANCRAGQRHWQATADGLSEVAAPAGQKKRRSTLRHSRKRPSRETRLLGGS